MKFRAATIVVIEPFIKRKDLSFFSLCFVSSEPINAACPEPMPGRNEQRGAEIADAIEDFINSFFGRIIFFRGLIICFWAFEGFFKEIIKFEIPKSPVKRGRRGCSIGRLRAKNPKNPDRRKIVNAGRIFSSLKIRNAEIKISMNGMIVFVASKITGRA